MLELRRLRRRVWLGLRLWLMAWLGIWISLARIRLLGSSFNDNSSYSSPDNNSSSPDTESESNSDSNSVTAAPVDQGWSQPYSGANATVPVLLYMKNGSVYSARDYWFSNDQFHYVLMNGREVVIDADQLDMKRTNEENAKSGVRFVVKSQPNSPPPPPDDAAPATPASGNPGPAN